MADPICRWRNATAETVCELVRNLPHEIMPKSDFRIKMNDRWNGFFHTTCQLACQLGLYYESKDKIYYPRFYKDISLNEATVYLENWIHHYYVPNPYNRGFHELGDPVNLIENIVKYIEQNPTVTNFDNVLISVLKESIGNTDILINAINSFSKVLKINNLTRTFELLDNYKKIIYMNNRKDKKSFFENFSSYAETKIDGTSVNIQKIYYGAPGTGKSHKIKGLTKNTENKTIVTFHPDTDYSSFVGCYKPMVSEDKKTITYGFTPQAFAKAYVSAWNNLDKPYYLVIEEINRGNCAQIFGDIFQLLDRYDNGFSKYVIDVDSDFEGYLESELSSTENYKEDISQLAEISIDEFKFSKIALPNNLHILATMNTSDQSLFPMDSAFKRRWDWEYIPIDTEKVKEVKIEIGTEIYSWSAFLDSVNKFIYEVNTSEDKQIGPFFIKANETTNIITFEQFRSKVMFYLWFEIYKDEDRDSIFKTNRGSEDNKKMEPFTFGDLFKSDGVELLHKFMMDSMQLTPTTPTNTVDKVVEESPEANETE